MGKGRVVRPVAPPDNGKMDTGIVGHEGGCGLQETGKILHRVKARHKADHNRAFFKTQHGAHLRARSRIRPPEIGVKSVRNDLPISRCITERLVVLAREFAIIENRVGTFRQPLSGAND